MYLYIYLFFSDVPPGERPKILPNIQPPPSLGVPLNVSRFLNNAKKRKSAWQPKPAAPPPPTLALPAAPLVKEKTNDVRPVKHQVKEPKYEPVECKITTSVTKVGKACAAPHLENVNMNLHFHNECKRIDEGILLYKLIYAWNLTFVWTDLGLKFDLYVNWFRLEIWLLYELI